MIFYKLLLEKSSVHKFKRFYLLGALVFALVIPSLTFIEYIEPVINGEFTSFVIPDFEIIETTPEVIEVNYTPIILWSLYGLGVFIFLLKFSLNLNNIISRIKSNPRLKSKGFVNVLVSNLKIPHTFFNYIFFNKHKFEHNDIPKEVLIHEQTHAKQKHSIDVLILEVLQIIFWFNPLIYLLKREVKLNHEFLADQAVLQNGIEPSTYQNILLAFSSNARHQELANAINYSSIKKRFTVMKTHTSRTSIWLRSLLILPVLAILLYGFTEREQVIKEKGIDENIKKELKKADAYTINYLNNSTEGVSEALMKEYNNFIIDFNTTHTINYSKYERIVSIYNLMSQEQKASVEQYPKVPGVDLSETKAKIPTTEEFESWKNEKEYAIWIDGVHVPNANLDSYNLNDIAHYVGSFVYKNARSEKFPQPYQFSLYTKKGFESTYQISKVKEYRALTKKYSDDIQLFLKGNRLDNSELILLNERCYRLYKSFTEEEIQQHKLLPAPPPPAKKQSQKKATPEQLAEYNKLAKKYNEQPKDKRVIRLKDIERLEYLYKIMSDEQKKNAEPFPDCPPPPAPPILSSEQLEEYNKLAKKHNDKPENLRIIKVKDYKYLEGLYQAMSEEQKENSQPFPSFNTTPPPPPPPPAPKVIYEKDFMWILLNSKGQFLVNDELGSLQSIENEFKVIAKTKRNSKKIVFRYDENTPKDIVDKVNLLIKKYDLKNINNDVPPPPPPPITAPIKKGNGPNGSEYYPIPPPIPENATPEQRAAMQATIDAFEKKHKREVHHAKSDAGDIYSVIINDQHYDPSQQNDNEVKTGFIKINGTPHYFVSINNNTKYYNRKGFEVNKSGKTISSNQVNATDVIPGQYITKAFSDGQIVSEFKDNRPSRDKTLVDIPPPPPMSTLDLIIDMAKKNAKFYYENENISSDKAIELIKSNKELNVQAIKTNSKQPQVFISKKPIHVNRGKSKILVTVNGKTNKDNQYSLTKKELENLKLTLKKVKVISFKMKLPGQKSQHNVGNTLNSKTKNLINNSTETTVIQLFDIKDNEGFSHPPILITISK
jgi:hypothetical protein